MVPTVMPPQWFSAREPPNRAPNAGVVLHDFPESFVEAPRDVDLRADTHSVRFPSTPLL